VLLISLIEKDELLVSLIEIYIYIY